MIGLYLVLIFISAATLAFQVVLIRLFSLAQGSHLAFMAVSLALLGAGASGTFLSLKQVTVQRLPRILTGASILFAISIPAAYITINYLPFDAYRLAWERIQLLWLAVYYLALAVPFFFGGLTVGAALAAFPERAGLVYGANLLGAGLGPPLALISLALIGGPGTVLMCALLGLLAAISYQIRRSDNFQYSGNPAARSFTPKTALLTLLLLALAFATFILARNPPPFLDVRLTPYKSLSQSLLYPGSEVIFSRWNAFSRVDVVRSDGIRSAPGLSFTYPGNLPPQLGLTVDGDNLTPITRPNQSDFTQHLPLALVFNLRPDANVLILEPGGGLAALTALENGAKSVTVVQSNHTISDAVTHRFADFNNNLYADPRVTVITDEPRRFLRRTNRRFDLIILPLTDSFRPVTAGAYTLNEDYRYTIEAFADAIAHLTPTGLLVVERWLQLPPSESLRLWGTLQAAAQYAELPGGLQNNALAMRSMQTGLMALGRSPLSKASLTAARQFATDNQFDLIWLPDIHPAEANRYSIVPEASYYQTFSKMVQQDDPFSLSKAYPFAVAPPTDNHPYFFNFFRWQQTPQILQALGKTWQPFGGSGYLVLLILLALLLLLSIILILLPLFWNKRLRQLAGNRRQTIAYLFYFILLGLGFLFVEIPLLQRFILYLGQPAYAFAVVTSALLIASGVGSSLLSKRFSLRLVLPLITLMIIIYPFILPYLFDITFQFSFAMRIALTAVVLFPLGMLLGVPFPRSISLIAKESPGLTPWVWAVNGCASVVSAVLAAMVALTWGFSAVLWGAAAAYGLAWFVVIAFKKNFLDP